MKSFLSVLLVGLIVVWSIIPTLNARVTGPVWIDLVMLVILGLPLLLRLKFRG